MTAEELRERFIKENPTRVPVFAGNACYGPTYEAWLENKLLQIPIHPPVDAEKNDNLIDEINNEITNVHEHMEGRYELNGSDLFNIHHLLCRFQNMLMK